MSSDQTTKQFEATHTRLEKARKDGDVPRSAELSGTIAFASGLGGLCLALPVIAGTARETLVAICAHPSNIQSGRVAALAAWSLAPIACAAAGGTVAIFVQAGGLQWTAITAKVERLNPVTGFKRMASRESIVNAVRALAAVACVAAALLPAIMRTAASGGGVRDAQALGAFAWGNAVMCGFLVAGTGLMFGSADFALAFAKWRKRLRMSFDELKREQKEQDGDPAAKGRRRSMHRELSRASVQRVREASFIIVNPTHVAVAIEYRPPAVNVPRVLLRAADESALRIRDAAVRFGVPIVENVPLARSLYASAKAGEFIPKETYIAMAEIVAALVKSGALA